MKTKTDDRILQIIEQLKTKYPPAAKEADSKLQLTTAEILAALSQLDPESVFEETDVYQVLLDAGYIYSPIEEDEQLTFKWLLGQ